MPHASASSDPLPVPRPLSVCPAVSFRATASHVAPAPLPLPSLSCPPGRPALRIWGPPAALLFPVLAALSPAIPAGPCHGSHCLSHGTWHSAPLLSPVAASTLASAAFAPPALHPGKLILSALLCAAFSALSVGLDAVALCGSSRAWFSCLGRRASVPGSHRRRHRRPFQYR